MPYIVVRLEDSSTTTRSAKRKGLIFLRNCEPGGKNSVAQPNGDFAGESLAGRKR